MFSHEQIWMAVDRLAESRGLSASGLARQAGLDPTSFNRSKRISPNGKPRWPSTESLAKILAVTECTMADLLSMMEQDAETSLRVVPHIPFAAISAGRLSGDGGRPAMLAVAFDVGRDCFAVTVEGSGFHPLLRAGSIVVADPSAKIRAEDRILFFSKKTGLESGIAAGGKRGLSVLIPGDSFAETTFADSDIEWVARILWASQ